MHPDYFRGMATLVYLQMVEPMKGRYLPVLFKAIDLKIVPDTDVIPNAIFIEEPYPMLANKLPISQQAIDTLAAKPLDKPLHKRNAFFLVGISPFVQHSEHQWESHIPVTHSQH